MKNSRTDIDRLFEQGVSDLERQPKKSLTETEIAAAATASKSGAGIWLLSHAKEMLIGAVSFVAGCLVTFAVLHYTASKPSDPQAGANMTDMTDVAVVDNNFDHDLDYNIDSCHDLNHQGKNDQAFHLQTPESQVQSLKSQVQSPEFQEPVVVKKTIIQRDTVQLHETVIVKDTVYIN